MRLLLVTAEFPPLRSSGAVQMRDFALDLVAQGHEVLCVCPVDFRRSEQADLPGVQVVRPRIPFLKSRNRLLRGVAEVLIPVVSVLWLLARRSRVEGFDGVVWYSPTIFLGPIVRVLKAWNGCRGYLILRDIFPEWALDLGVLRDGAAYRFFRRVAAYQYAVADVIGVQTAGNLAYFPDTPGRRVEVLHNWLAPQGVGSCSIDIAATPLAGRRIFVYAGNMGVAQGVGILLDVAGRLRGRRDIGFVFVGRGTDAEVLRADVAARGLDNVLFFDEIDPSEIPGLYAQCDAGLLTLDPRHRSHNIPGKFLSYMQAGLPVLARVNEGNDLVDLIRHEGVGRVSTAATPESLAALVGEMTADTAGPAGERCRALAARMFSVRTATQQVMRALGATDPPVD